MLARSHRSTRATRAGACASLHFDAVAAAMFRAIERRVGALQGVQQGFAVPVPGDAARDGDRTARITTDAVAQCDAGADPFGAVPRAVEAGLAQDEEEFV